MLRNPIVLGHILESIRMCWNTVHLNISWNVDILISGHMLEYNAPKYKPEYRYFSIRLCVRTCQNTIHLNTSRNVDIPVLGSSRYIETQSPADSNHQCNQVHQFTCYFTCSFTLSSSDSRSPINTISFATRN